MSIQIVKGDLIAMAKEGQFDIIAHGCNCQNVMGAGIAYQLSQEWPDILLIDKEYRQGFKEPYNMMGTYSEHITAVPSASIEDIPTKWLTILNLYTQMWPGRPSPNSAQPFDYNAFNLVCKKLNYHFKGKSIGIPWIGCGLAGANQSNVKRIVLKTMINMDVTIVEYEPRQTTVGVDREGLAKMESPFSIGKRAAGEDSLAGDRYGELDERPLDWK